MNNYKSEFIKNHSLNYLEMALRTDRIERIENPDGYGKKIGDCGDTIEFFLLCHKSILKSVCFYTRGCLNTNACCNVVAEFAQGKTIDEAWEILPGHVIEYLETLPHDHSHCAQLAVGTLYLALTNICSKKSSGRCGKGILKG
jgi:nitrogen fixation NifU-like protein